jgi:hypothetical protein
MFLEPSATAQDPALFAAQDEGRKRAQPTNDRQSVRHPVRCDANRSAARQARAVRWASEHRAGDGLLHVLADEPRRRKTAVKQRKTGYSLGA